jgi:hypothetical protein
MMANVRRRLISLAMSSASTINTLACPQRGTRMTKYKLLEGIGLYP